jgi:hypothetical protein
MRYITHVALKRNGVIYSLPKPNRHHHLFSLTVNDPKEDDDEQGFLDNDGMFLNRAEAFIVATNANQLKPRRPGGYDGELLFSEDIW